MKTTVRNPIVVLHVCMNSVCYNKSGGSNWSPLNMNGDLLTAGIDLIKKTKKTLSYYTESIADVSSIDFSNNE